MNGAKQIKENFRFFSFKEVQKLTGLSRSTIYREVKRGNFPKPRILSERKVGFLAGDLERWSLGREFAGSLTE